MQQVAYLEGALQQAIGDYESVLAEIVRLRKEMQKSDADAAAKEREIRDLHHQLHAYRCVACACLYCNIAP